MSIRLFTEIFVLRMFQCTGDGGTGGGGSGGGDPGSGSRSPLVT